MIKSIVVLYLIMDYKTADYVVELLARNDETTCTELARMGYLKFLQDASKNGCPWDDMACAFAAENGHLEVLKWLIKSGCPWDSLICTDAAAEYGQLEVLIWLSFFCCC